MTRTERKLVKYGAASMMATATAAVVIPWANAARPAFAIGGEMFMIPIAFVVTTAAIQAGYDFADDIREKEREKRFNEMIEICNSWKREK